MGRRDVERLVTEIAGDVIQQFPEIELVDVEYVKEGGEWVLRVYIDKETGVNLDDCESVSRVLSDRLDEADPIPGSYLLEVSSPGLERPLKRPADFERFAGEWVMVTSFAPINGRKQWQGKLIGLVDGNVQVETTQGLVQIPHEQVASARLAVKF